VRAGFVRATLLAAGWLCFFVGWAGVLLPLIPGTPILILAAACFARSSPRAERWLLQNRFVGPPLVRWRQTRTVDARIKAWGLVVIALSFAVGVARAGTPWLRGALVLLGAALLLALSLVRTRAQPPGKG
jgi:hypothetical protein